MLASKSKLTFSIFLGLIFIVSGFLFVLVGRNPEIIQSESFASEPIETSKLNYSVENSDKLPQRIVIPTLSIDLDINPAQRINGYWQVFPDSAGWGEGSGLPGESGNQVIFAHARRGLFENLKDIRIKDTIYILTSTSQYSYTVKTIKTVYPYNIEVIAPTTTETLTLYTCSGFSDSKRLIVVAERIP